MEYWKEILHNSISNRQELQNAFKKFELPNDFDKIIAHYPMRINSYFLNLIENPHDPIWKQAIPDSLEIHDSVCMPDPLGEESLSPVPNLVHKYPDRVLFLVSNKCAMYCRFCTRKRKVGMDSMHISSATIEKGLTYLRNTPAVREVLLSGGDPLLLEDDQLDYILSQIHQISHIEVIRIGTRVPSTLPMRITKNLVEILKKYHPLYINTHFNHPRELTKEAETACNLLVNAGIPMGCQTVLLKGINDNSQTLKSLFLGLLKMRVKPYYLFQTDLTLGTNHLRTSTKTGINLMQQLIGHISGMAIPTFALDAPGGKGKIPLSPQYIIESGANLKFKNYLGEQCNYQEIIEY